MLMYLHSHYYLTFWQLLRYFDVFCPFSPFIRTPSCLNCDENWWHWFFYTEFATVCIVVFTLTLLSALMSDLGWQIENQNLFSSINKIDSHVDFSPKILVTRLCLFYIFYIIKLIHTFCIDIIVWPFCPILTWLTDRKFKFLWEVPVPTSQRIRWCIRTKKSTLKRGKTYLYDVMNVLYSMCSISAIVDLLTQRPTVPTRNLVISVYFVLHAFSTRFVY